MGYLMYYKAHHSDSYKQRANLQPGTESQGASLQAAWAAAKKKVKRNKSGHRIKKQELTRGGDTRKNSNAENCTEKKKKGIAQNRWRLMAYMVVLYVGRAGAAESRPPHGISSHFPTLIWKPTPPNAG